MWNWIDWTSYDHIFSAMRTLNVSFTDFLKIWRSI